MNDAYDSLDSVNPYLNPDKVTPAHHSERDKDRKFARTLKDKLEEDLEKRKKNRKKDTLDLHRVELEEEPPDEIVDTPPAETGADNPDEQGLENDDKNEVKEESGHIDLKA
jgi:hypothetical protein